MGRAAKLLIAALVAAVVLVVGGVALYFGVIKDDPPERVSLSDDTVPATDEEAESPDGQWTVQEGETTFLGYRVTEEFASIPAPSDAVGRTPAVQGSLTIEGSRVSAAEITGDLSQLTSDEDRRDNTIRENGLQTDEFPEATFVLSEPIDLGAAPEAGTDLEVTAVGDLTLHGVTNRVEIPLEARWSGDTIEVVGTLPIAFSDYDIEPPNVGGFVTVEDNGEMELSLTFIRA